MSYLLRKVVALLVTLFLVSLLTFFAFNIVPGDPVALMLGTEATQERVDALKAALHLDKALPERYVDWLSGFALGDLGESIKYSTPVKDLIGPRFPVTGALALLSFALIVAISLPLGIYCAKRRGSLADRAIGTLLMIDISLPSFFLGILFIWLFGIVLKLFAPGGYVDFHGNPAGFFRYMIFPAIAVALPNIAVTVKFLRASAIAQLRAGYVRTAYGKGNTDDAVLYRHVLKNAILPVITLFGMIVAEVFSGSIIIEQVFSLPGIGRLLISSITSRDFPVVETLVVYIAFLVVLANFTADVVLQLLDPRIKVR